MNVMSYNCLGLGKGQAYRKLAEFERREFPRVLFLMETKSSTPIMEFIRRTLGYADCFTIDCVGRSGGLCLFCKERVNLNIKSYTLHHTDAEICSEALN